MNTLYGAKAKKTSAQSIKERVKTFEDACEVLGLENVQVGQVGLDKHSKSIEAYAKLSIISEALNEGWKPDWSNSNEYKYVAWFEHKSGLGLSCLGCDDWSSNATVGSRLCFKSSELAIYAGKQFEDIYRDYLTL